MTWLDIGEMHGRYSEAGAHNEGPTANRGLEWPAILRRSGHFRSKAYWIGLKDWTDESGRHWDYRVTRIGLRVDGYLSDTPAANLIYTPVETKLIARFEDTEVVVDGSPSFDKIAIVNEVDPQLPADRVLYQRYRSLLGIETERWIYAYANEIHDDYHIIRRRMVNTGNTDADPDIELEGQSLHDVLFYNAYRWRGREQAAWHGSGAQVWGKFSMVDIVGDGNEAYPVDFTAVYLWYGFDWSAFDWEAGIDYLGSPMLSQRGREAPGDTIGRLAGMSMQGRVILHADESTTDRTYNPANQPITLGWIDNDEPLNNPGQSEEAYYELGILTRENPAFREGGSSRLYPHYADRIVPSGEFWERVGDAAQGKAGGHSPSIAYGPYQMAFRDTINIVEAEGAAGLSYKAATDIGVAYKASGFDNELRIPFDANGDGIINDVPWNYDVYKNGSEIQTKNQWVLTARDSMFQFMYRARDVWRASDGMTQYPIVEPPRPPRRFEVTSHPGNIELEWQSMSEAPDPEAWEVYRTGEYVDNLPYELIASLPGSSRSYIDVDVFRGRDYYYFIQAVGSPNPEDDLALNGTPGGLPLRSGRYFTQTYNPASLLRVPGNQVSDFRIVPNPINMAADESVRIIIDGDRTRGQVEFLDIPGQCTISIYTEIGELVKRIEHTNGSGNAEWDLLTASRQPVVSGIYIVHVLDNDLGEVDVKKLVVVR
ncbi:MAG: T9SS type A sorting domain-containing protein [Rhodothermaceae bacterium]|nr:T9SS type A sorting domain-containing protein [Rhodothermaceae bacterium]